MPSRRGSSRSDRARQGAGVFRRGGDHAVRALQSRRDDRRALEAHGVGRLCPAVVGARDLIGLGKALGFSAAEAITLFEHFNPGAMTGARSKRMASGDYAQPSWELAM